MKYQPLAAIVASSVRTCRSTWRQRNRLLSGGWGWGAFGYDEASGTFRPANAASKPRQGNDAKCGLACHTDVVTRDYVFTEYGRR